MQITRPRRRRTVLTSALLLVCLLTMLLSASQSVVAQDDAASPGTSSASDVDDLASTLEAADAGAPTPPEADPRIDCAGPGLQLIDNRYCVHVDPENMAGGLDDEALMSAAVAERAVAAAIPCVGNGKSGPRIQALYVRVAGGPDRYAANAALFQQVLQEVNDIYYQSAVETGGERHLRFFHDANCVPIIERVTINPYINYSESISGLIDQLDDRGYMRNDRKYLVFFDPRGTVCGLGTKAQTDTPEWWNTNNIGATFAVAYGQCWDSHTVAHELMHTMGGVQNSAPNSTSGGHCVDEYDIMCYSDAGGGNPPMVYLCDNPALELRFDCNDDDYYNTNPASGSYLATKWNAANSSFLVGGYSVACPDFFTFGWNNNAARSTSMAVNSTQKHAFCTPDDQDWISFEATASKDYTIETLNLGAASDPVVALYTCDPNDGSYQHIRTYHQAARTTKFVYRPTASRTFCLQIYQSNSTHSDAHTYSVRVTGPALTTETVAPTVTATVSPAATASGWHKANVTVTLQATDNAGGSGVAGITYRVDGANVVAPTTSAGASVSLVVTTEGYSTVGYLATDNAGNEGPWNYLEVRIDRTKPTLWEIGHSTLQRPITPTAIPVKLTWRGDDPFTGDWWAYEEPSGINKYVLQQSTNGGAYTNVSLPSPKATSVVVRLIPGTYRFRVRAIDRAGNASTYTIGNTFVLEKHEESSPELVDSGAWTTANLTGASGGAVQSAYSGGRSASFTFTGDSIAWITTLGPGYGKAEVLLYRDGFILERQMQVDLYSPTRKTRQSAVHWDGLWSGYSYRLEIRVLGTKNAASSGKRVDIDAFVVQRVEWE